MKDSQDADDREWILACARIVMRRLSETPIYDKNFSLYGAVQDFEAKLIEQALEESGGRVTKAARLLGITHQNLKAMLDGRHKRLQGKRTPPKKRLKSIIKKDPR